MVNYPYGSEFIVPLPGHPIRELCRKIDGCPDGTSTLERIFEGISIYYNYTGKAECFELEDTSDVGTDGWNWQACTEMVMSMSSSRDKSMFPMYDFNLSSLQEWCWKEFNAKPRLTWITTEFGGHYIMATLKCLEVTSYSPTAYWIHGVVAGTHHIDLRFSTKNDPDWLVQQRASETKLIQGWLDNFYKEKTAAF